MSIKEIGAAITELTAKVNTLLTGKANAEQVEATVVDFKTQIKAVTEQLESLGAENTTLAEQITDLNQKIETQKADHEAALQAKDDEVTAKAGKVAAATSASQGVPPVAVKDSAVITSNGTENPKTIEEFSEGLNQIADTKKRAAYYAQHSDKFFR